MYLTGGVAGALGLWLGFPNDFISFPPLVFAWPAALTLLGREASSRAQALRLGWLATIAGGIAALYWLTLPVHNVGGLPWLLAIAKSVDLLTVITVMLTIAGLSIGKDLPMLKTIGWKIIPVGTVAIAASFVLSVIVAEFALGIWHP